GSQSSRILGSAQASAWVLGIGFVIMLPLALEEGPPSGVSASTWAWTVVAAVSAVGGFLLMYAALRVGPVSLVTPVLSAEGAVAAAFGVLAGEPLTALVAIGLGGVCVGAAVVVRRPPGEQDEHARASVRAATIAIVCAVTFGVALYSSARAGEVIGSVWML